MEAGIEGIDDYHGRFRLRSERRRKRAAKDDYEKELRRMGREWIASRRKLNALGWEELNPPVQRGYIRFFVLREDIKRSRKAGFFEKLLSKINTSQYSHRKDFLVKQRKHGKKIYVPREHTLPLLERWELNRAELTVEERAYFYEDTVYDARLRRSRVVFRFIEPWRFVLRIQPNIITKARKIDVDLERHAAALSHYFDDKDRWYRWVKLKRGNTHKPFTQLPKHPTPEKYISPFLNRSFADILEEYYPEPMFLITHKNPQPPGDFSFYRRTCQALRSWKSSNSRAGNVVMNVYRLINILQLPQMPLRVHYKEVQPLIPRHISHRREFKIHTQQRHVKLLRCLNMLFLQSPQRVYQRSLVMRHLRGQHKIR